MGKDVIVACDFASAEQTFAFLDKFTGRGAVLCRRTRNRKGNHGKRP